MILEFVLYKDRPGSHIQHIWFPRNCKYNVKEIIVYLCWHPPPFLFSKRQGKNVMKQPQTEEKGNEKEKRYTLYICLSIMFIYMLKTWINKKTFQNFNLKVPPPPLSYSGSTVVHHFEYITPLDLLPCLFEQETLTR